MSNKSVSYCVLGMGYPVVGMNMIVDPNMMSMNNYGMMTPMMATPDPTLMPGDPGGVLVNPVKEIIHCKSCTLFPPNPNAPPPMTRERPPGCRTVSSIWRKNKLTCNHYFGVSYLQN